MQIFQPDSTKIATLTRGYAKIRSTDPILQHPTDPTLLRQITPVEHARIKGVPEKMIEGLGITIAHQMLGQSILAKPFRALADHIGNARVAWQHGITLPKPRRARGMSRRSEEHTSEPKSLIRISYAAYSWKNKHRD